MLAGSLGSGTWLSRGARCAVGNEAWAGWGLAAAWAFNTVIITYHLLDIMAGLGSSRARFLVELGKAKAEASLEATPLETRTRRVVRSPTNLPWTHICCLHDFIMTIVVWPSALFDSFWRVYSTNALSIATDFFVSVLVLRPCPQPKPSPPLRKEDIEDYIFVSVFSC